MPSSRSFGSSGSALSSLILDSNNADERDLSSAETSSRPFLTYSSRSMSGWLSLPPVLIVDTNVPLERSLGPISTLIGTPLISQS